MVLDRDVFGPSVHPHSDLVSYTAVLLPLILQYYCRLHRSGIVVKLVVAVSVTPE